MYEYLPETHLRRPRNEHIPYCRIKTQRVRQAWTTRGPARVKTEAAALRRAIADADWDTAELHGGLDAAVK